MVLLLYSLNHYVEITNFWIFLNLLILSRKTLKLECYRLMMAKEVTNVLRLLLNIKKFNDNDLSKINTFSKENPLVTNRANHMGEAFEFFVKDAFCGTLNEKKAENKRNEYNNNFCYLGNQNNPPDIMIKSGDAVEVKKITGSRFNDLALNSSYPKSKLYANSPMITQACINCEKWSERDIIYAVGQIEKSKIRFLALVYGDCYSASAEVYERVRDKIIEGINKTNLEYSKTNELGRINRVDPLGITNLRIRGMWTIKNPLTVFSKYLEINKNSRLSVFLLLKKEKYLTFNGKDRELIELDKDFKVSEVKIPNPDNPAKQINAMIIKYEK